MKRWHIYKNDQNIGQFITWQRSLQAIKNITDTRMMIVEFISSEYLRVKAS